jgi:hypothetical protein
VSGTAAFNTRSTSTVTEKDPPPPDLSFNSRTDVDKAYRATVALNWDFFDGLATDGQNAFANARCCALRRRTTTCIAT